MVLKEPLRVCRECGKICDSEKELDNFIKSNRCKYGRINMCKECFNRIRKEWRKNPSVKWHGKIYQPRIKLIEFSKIKREDFIYWAGAIDGDGSVTIFKMISKRNLERSMNCSPYYCLCVSFSNVSEELVKEWRNTFEESNNRNRTYRTDFRGRNPVYSFKFIGIHAYSILKGLLPYLRLKKERAELAIDFWEKREYGQGRRLPQEEIEKRESYYRRMKELQSHKNWKNFR